MIEMSAVALLVTIALINYFKVTSSLKKDMKLATNTLYSFSIVCMTWLLVSIISYGLLIKNYQHLGVYENVHQIALINYVELVINTVLIAIIGYMLNQISLNNFTQQVSSSDDKPNNNCDGKDIESDLRDNMQS